MVGTGRFELPTCRLGGGRSIHLSYVPAHECLIGSLPAAEAFLANVFAVLHAIEMDLRGCLVGPVDGHL